jgi:hypothetical protein
VDAVHVSTKAGPITDYHSVLHFSHGLPRSITPRAAATGG